MQGSIGSPAMQGQESRWGVMAAVCLSIFMSTLDINIVNVSLPTLVRQLDTNFATIQWVILGYVLVITSMTLGFARLGDLFGMRRLFATGLGLFTVSSLLCGLAPSVHWLILFRVCQGMGAAMTQSVGAAIVTAAFPSSQRGKAMGLIGTTVSVGLASGPPLGGLIIGLVGWRFVFLINVPIDIAAVYLALRFVRDVDLGRKGERFDVAGAAILLAALSCYALGMTLGQRQGFGHGPTLALLAGAATGLALFVAVQRKVAHPMVDLGLFRNLLFSLNLLMSFLTFVAVASAFLIPFFLELVKGYTPQTVGLLMMVVPVCMGVMAPLAGTLSDRLGSRGVSLVGLVCALGGCLSLSTLDAQVGIAGVVMRLAPFGIGLGLFQAPNNSAVMGAAPRNRLGVASGLLTQSRTLGHISGIPLSGAIFTAIVLASAGLAKGADPATADPAHLVAGIQGAYAIICWFLGASAVLAAVCWRIDRPKAR